MQIVDGKDYLSEVKKLIIEYSQRLGRDLSFQNIDDELQDLAHKYTNREFVFLNGCARGNNTH